MHVIDARFVPLQPMNRLVSSQGCCMSTWTYRTVRKVNRIMDAGVVKHTGSMRGRYCQPSLYGQLVLPSMLCGGKVWNCTLEFYTFKINI